MPQLTMTFDPETEASLDAAFAVYHAENPQIYATFRAMAGELKRRGFGHYGAKSIFEAMRFHHGVSAGPDSEFKLNNNFTSRYARKLMTECREFRGFFETRRLVSREVE
jgi:hypothetical protein